jgi:hypothetical protein
MEAGWPYEHANGLIELKTEMAPLKRGQQVLELCALSKISRFQKHLALLATDCYEKWELCYFSDNNTILPAEPTRAAATAGKPSRSCSTPAEPRLILWQDWNLIWKRMTSKTL